MGIFEKFFRSHRTGTKKEKLKGGADLTAPTPETHEREEEKAEAQAEKGAVRDEAGEGGETAPEPREAEVSAPEEERRETLPFHIDTVADFISLLEIRLREARGREGAADAGAIFYQIVKIRNGLSSAGLRADEVRVREMEPGVLGVFDPANREIAAARALLEDFGGEERLFAAVFLHEATHREGVADEGPCQLMVEMKVGAVPGVYPAEKRGTKKTFNDILGMNKAAELYDIDEPEKLAEGYIAAKLKKEMKIAAVKEISADRKKFKSVTEKLKKEVGDSLEKGAPRLYGKLKAQGFDFRKKIEKAIDRMGK